jgi:hypothetical protein
VESYLSNEFEAKLKKIVAKSRANIGKANSSPNRHYDLWTGKTLKSGWKAFGLVLSMFDIKIEFVPYESNEDFFIKPY